jgi:hypothetical protein
VFPLADCGKDFVDVLVDVKAKIDICVLGLSGRESQDFSTPSRESYRDVLFLAPADPKPPKDCIVDALDAAVILIADIHLDTPIVNADINLCVDIIVHIIVVRFLSFNFK